MPEAAALAIKHSMDLECSGNDYSHYLAAVKNGLLKESELDGAVKRLMRARIRMGLFDPPSMVKYAQTPSSEIDSEAHRQLALRAARESMVLLKNDGVLPLRTQPRNIAVVGPLADSARVLLGNYNGIPSRSTTVLDGIQKQFPHSRVTFAAGTPFLRVNIPVPNSALSTTGGKAGLKYELFRGTDFQGQPVQSDEIDQVYMNYTTRDYTAASARFSGFLTAEQSGKYKLSVTGDGVYRMWLDGKLVIEGGRLGNVSTTSADLSLDKGRKYSLKLEFVHNGGPLITKLVWTLLGDTSLDAAVQAAKVADVVVAVVGLNSDLEREEGDINLPGFNRGDRTSIDLPKEEEDLLKAVKVQGKPLVLVLMNGSALAVNWASQNANAILDAWYPGEEGGTAVAETLAGVNNPAGRLPVTFYKSTDQLPPFADYSMAKRTYRYFDGQPLYPFGFGLSYSGFTYSNLKFSSSNLKAGDALTAEAEVRNTSQLDGDEVAQLYLIFPSIAGAPPRALRGFTRVHVPAGRTEHVRFKLDPRDLSLVNQAGTRVIAPGEYRLTVGGGQPGTGIAEVDGRFSIVGEVTLPD
jgi:beta-glucosidase